MKIATLTQSELALSLSGITEAFAPMVCEYIIKKYPSPVSIIFVKHEKIAEQWIEDIELITYRITGSNLELNYCLPCQRTMKTNSN